MFSLFFVSCDFFSDGDLEHTDSDESEESVSLSEIESIKLNKTKLELKVGSMEYITITYKPTNVVFVPDFKYDSSKIEVTTQKNGAVIKGLAEGQSEFTVSAGNCSATCIVTVTGFEPGFEKTVEPYIYSNTNILQLSPNLSEKVFVSLYGGSAADINDYNWTIDDGSVGSLSPTGQYCLIKAKSSGYTRIKVTHSKATYPYYMGLYVFDDPSKACYITTPNNILTMNMDDEEKTISVSLVNGLESSLDTAFHWEIIDNSSDCPITLNSNGSKAVVTPKKNGYCTIRVTHPDAAYPLDILCRIISIVKNVYIEPDRTIVNLEGSNEENINVNLMNIDISEYSLNDYTFDILNDEVAQITAQVGNMVAVKGLKNGSTKLIIGHSKSAYTREVLLISSHQLADAVDASCFITTTDNYIRTKVGATPSKLNISLKGGNEGDEKDFSWTIKSTPTDGSSDSVISLETPTGKVFGRAAKSTFSYGNAYINPLKEGTAVITVTHPKVLYPTEILVKVLSKDSILEEPLYFKGDGLIRVLNGQEINYSVSLNGNNKSPYDNQDISWEIDDDRLSIAGNEDKVTITSPILGTGNTISHLTVSHPKVDYPKSVLVLTADDEETLMNMKALFTDKNYYNLEAGKTIYASVDSVGFEKGYDFSSINWSVDKSGIIDYECRDNDRRYISITGLKSGTVKLKASVEDCECIFTITVYPIGAVQISPEYYFTTTQNVIIFGEVNTAKLTEIVAVNMPASMYSDITWSCSDDSICEVIPNRTSATITALKEGEAVISVSHPESQNTLKIYVKIGSEYIIPESSVVYISSQDVITMLKNDQPQKLQAMLVNYNGVDGEQFNFSIDNTSVAKITAQSKTGTAFISPVGSGQAEVTITNPLSEITKKVLIVVGNSAEELAGITYLTTTNNVVSISEGKTKTVSVSVKNAENIVIDGYSWVSSNYSIADVIDNGATASIKANGVGTAIITVTNTACNYPLEIIVHVVDPIAAAAQPYIQLNSSVLVLEVDNSYTSITADLVGGNEGDYSRFNWSSNDSSICSVYGQNEVGKLKAVGEGTTYVTVSHPKANYSAQLLVVCEKKNQSDCYISVPTSIVNMKPTDEATTITATLVNGNANDKYNFKWSLDVYDIIDLQYSANICTIRPKQAGTTTITLTHPKADYDQQIIVTVQEYSTFAFPSTNITLTQGDVKFVNMQVPVTNVKTHIEYFVKNEQICSISGTKEVAQVTGISNGTTTVSAKLVASNTGAIQATADMMVYVKERATTDAYITSSSTIYTVQKGKSQTLKATVTGTDVTSADQGNLKWNCSDSDIIELTGIGADGYVRGQSIYITAKKPGEAIITCSHEKAKSVLEFYVVVPGTDKKLVTLDKSYMTLVKGNQGTVLKASIENSESNEDYQNLEWKSVGPNGTEGSSIARVMGNGKQVMIYPVSPGETTIYAQLPDSDSVGKCTVIVEAGKYFKLETTGLKIHPYEIKEIPYQVSPPNAIISWLCNTGDGEDYFSYEDLGHDSEGNGKLQVTGIKDGGQGVIMASTDGGATGKLTVKCAWTYDFKIQGQTYFSIKPKDTLEYTYSVCPANAIISVESPDLDEYFIAEITSEGELVEDKYQQEAIGKGVIKITSLAESPRELNILFRATNPINDGVVGEIPLKGYSKYRFLEVEKKNSKRVVGKWSREITDGIVLGDGEKMQLSLSLKEKDADAYVKRVAYNKYRQDSQVVIDQQNQVGKDLQVFVKHNYDYIKTTTVQKYKIDHLYYDASYPDWTNFHWEMSYTYHTFGKNDYYMLLVVPGGSCLSNGEQNTSNHAYMEYDLDNDSVKDEYCRYKQLSRQVTTQSGTTTEYYYDYTMVNKPALTEDTRYANTYMDISDFENCPWLFCPGSVVHTEDDFVLTWADIQSGKYRNGCFSRTELNVPPHVMTEHVAAAKVDVVTESTNTAVINYVLDGYITVYLNHCGKEEMTEMQIPVYVETRECRCN